ncbi:MAG: PDDEXK nuclease domain-containing protein [Paludibacteraceae bacterium]|nr:PDDEXK nuclease domain-containing protein [Paludibacteraceae bacterium]
MADIVKTDNCVNDIKTIIEQGRQAAYSSVNLVMVNTYWNIGRRIVEEEQKGQERAEYGKQLIDKIAIELRKDYGNGYSARYLRSFRQFYITIPDFEIWKSRFPNLMWTHIYRSLRLENAEAIRWYLETASKEMWSVRTLDRNISTQYYERHLLIPVKTEAEQAASKLEIIKNPVVAEFLGFKQDESYSESQLENAIITHLRDFIMEMGQGFAFMKRQQLVRTASEDYFIDLVFYNVILKCYVLIDLKVGKVTHQDVGQMDMYVRMYDELKRTEGDNPTIGIVLCSETDEDIAKYSILNGNEQIFATKYKLYLPTQEQLRAEIEKQKQIFYLQHPELKK